MIRVTMYCPVETKKQRSAFGAFNAALSLECGGLTIMPARGEWRDPEGLAHIEAVRVVVVLVENEEKMWRTVELLRAFGKDAQENTVLWTSEEVEARFEDIKHDVA